MSFSRQHKLTKIQLTQKNLLGTAQVAPQGTIFLEIYIFDLANNKMTVAHQAAVEIAVQPPHVAGVNRRLIPPVVARTQDPQLIQDYLSGTKHLFATAMLYSTTMTDHSDALGGNWSASAHFVTGNPESSRGGGSSSRGSRAQWLYFVFDQLSISLEGTFAFYVAISSLSLTSPDMAGMAETVGGRATREFTVLVQAPRGDKPSKLPSSRSCCVSLILTYCFLDSTERQVLRHLESAGAYVRS